MFENLKIVELASVLAGPMVGTFFAELGADVIKIENSTTNGDVTRSWKLPSEDKNSNVSAYYAAANFGKKSIFLDYTKSDEYAQVIDLIKTADIVIANFKAGDAIKLNLDFETLKLKNPEIIYAEINGFGTENDRVAFDVVLQAESGFMYMNGEKNAKPLKMPVALIDILAAHQLKEGILCALIKKLKSGKGSKVTISLFDAAVASLANQATNWLMNGQVPEAIGSEHPNIAPYGDLFFTKDEKWMILAVGSEKQFKLLCNSLNLRNILSDEKFNTNQNRIKNRSELNKILSDKVILMNLKEIETLFLDNQVPFGSVKNMQEVFQNEAAQKLVLEENLEGILTKRVKTVVFEILE